MIGLAAESNSNVPAPLSQIRETVGNGELTHTLYFDDADIRMIIASQVRGSLPSESGNDGYVDVWMKSGRARVNPSKGFSKKSMIAEKNRNSSLSSLTSLLATAVILLACSASYFVYQTSIYPWTDEFAIDHIAGSDAAERVVLGSDITHNTIRRWSSSLTQAGHKDKVLAIASRMQDLGDRLEIMASVAQVLATSNSLGDAAVVLDEALELANSNPPGMFDDGLRSIAEELAYLDRGNDAVYVVSLISGESLKAEGFLQVAMGFARHGNLNAAFNALNEIKNIEQRSQAMQGLLRRELPDPVITKAIDALLALGPQISDEHNWRSGSLTAVSRELIEQGDITRALKVARSIEKTSFRAGALTAVAKSFYDTGDVERARKILDERLNLDDPPGTQVALVYARLYEIDENSSAKARVVQMLDGAAASARQEGAFSEHALGSVAVAWAELGETERSFRLLDEIDLGFYKESVFDYYVASIQKLLALQKKEEIARLVDKAQVANKRCLYLVAFALASEPTESRQLLIEAEALTSAIRDESDESFALAAIAKVWARLHHYNHAIKLSERTRSFDRLHIHQEILDHYLSERKKK